MTVAIKDRGPQVVGLGFAFLALSTIAITMRVYCRLFVVKTFGIDDWSAVFAWILYVMYCTFSITGAFHGTGQHAWNIDPPEELPIGLKWWWACEPVYVLSNMALKLSIGIFLLRIAVAKTHRVVIWIAVGASQIYGAFFFLLFILQCRPSAYFWTRFTGGKGTCINPAITVNATYVYSAISCAADWTLAIIPVFLVWNLQMNIRTKISVAMILALGAIASTATVIRIPYCKNLANEADFLYATTDVACWSTIETALGIIASSIATLRPLFASFFNRTRLFGSSTGGTSNGWTKNPTGAGYIRGSSRGGGSRGGLESFGMRSDIGGKRGGVTTVIEGDIDLERQSEKNIAPVGRRTEAAGSLAGRPAGWSTSESKLTEVSSDEDSGWRGQGIMKTVSTKVAR